MKKRLIIIIVAVLVVAAALVVVIYRDSIFATSEPTKEISGSETANEILVDEAEKVVVADEHATDTMEGEEDPAFCLPSESETDASLSKVLADSEAELFFNNILGAGPAKDGIPPIENPIYTSIEEADVLFEDWDRMFVFEANDGVYVYPQRIMVWHEIVNDTIDGQLISVTYCPLTSSAIAYSGDDGLHGNNTYGTSGGLLNSNLVMYDRKTDSRIPQILGVGVSGDLSGIALSTKPIHWAQWSDVVATYDEAFVLSTETSFNRDYNRDPYGTYLPYDKWSYYQIGEPNFPLMSDNDGTFADVKVVVGVKSDTDVIALDPELVATQGVVNFDVGETKAVAIFDNELKTVRVFVANSYGENLTLSLADGVLTDQNDKVWSEKGISEQDDRLEPMTHFDVFWFAWHAYYPDTQVIQ